MLQQANMNLLVIKIGGSLITNRDQYRTPLIDGMNKHAQALALWQERYRCKNSTPMLLILGGGSYGHHVVQHHRLDSEGVHRRPNEVFELTAALFELKTMFAKAMQQHGLSAMPLQETGLFSCHRGFLRLEYSAPLYACIQSGFIPLITGGLMVEQGGSFLPIGSDRLAIPLASSFHLQRVAVITDQPGILQGGAVIKNVRPHQFDQVFENIRPPTKLDVTGGMRGKYSAAIEMAYLGVETVIAGTPEITPEWLESLFDSSPPGTLVEAAS